MYFWTGGLIFFVLAVLLIVAFVRTKQRDRAYGAGESEHEHGHHQATDEAYPTGRTTPKKQKRKH